MIWNDYSTIKTSLVRFVTPWQKPSKIQTQYHCVKNSPILLTLQSSLFFWKHSDNMVFQRAFCKTDFPYIPNGSKFIEPSVSSQQTRVVKLPPAQFFSSFVNVSFPRPNLASIFVIKKFVYLIVYIFHSWCHSLWFHFHLIGRFWACWEKFKT